MDNIRHSRTQEYPGCAIAGFEGVIIPRLVFQYCQEDGFIDPFPERRGRRVIYWAFKPNDVIATELPIEYLVERDRCSVNPSCPRRQHI